MPGLLALAGVSGMLFQVKPGNNFSILLVVHSHPPPNKQSCPWYWNNSQATVTCVSGNRYCNFFCYSSVAMHKPETEGAKFPQVPSWWWPRLMWLITLQSANKLKKMQQCILPRGPADCISQLRFNFTSCFTLCILTVTLLSFTNRGADSVLVLKSLSVFANSLSLSHTLTLTHRHTHTQRHTHSHFPLHSFPGDLLLTYFLLNP